MKVICFGKYLIEFLNIIDGNFEYKTASGKLRQARIIKNFKQDQDVNKKMFSEALKLVA